MIYKRGSKYFAIFKNNGYFTNQRLKKNYPYLQETEVEIDPVDNVLERGYDGSITDNRTIAFEFDTKDDAAKFIIDCLEKGLIDDEFVDWYGTIHPFKLITEQEIIKKVDSYNKKHFKTSIGYCKRINYKSFTEAARVFCWIAGNNMRVYYLSYFNEFLKNPRRVRKEEMEIQRTSSCTGLYIIADKTLNKLYNRLVGIY